METSLFPTLKQGCLAYFDSIVGAIPCKVETIVSDTPQDKRPASFQEVTATVTADRGAFRKGDKLKGWGLHFFPRQALGRGQFTQYIKPYRVQA